MTRTAATATVTTTNNLDALFADAEPPSATRGTGSTTPQNTLTLHP